MNFEELTTKRTSAINFLENIEIPKEDFKTIYNMVKNSPSAFNLQPTKFIIVTDRKLREQLYELNYRQYKLFTASAIVIVVAKLNFYQDAEVIYNPMKMLKMIDEDDYNATMQAITQFYTPLDEHKLRLEVEKNAMIAATTWLYASQELGWDTCPMPINNFNDVASLLSIPNALQGDSDGYVPILMIPMGKSYEKSRKRGFRKPFSQGCSLDKF